jgi:hypothetical protein
VCGDWAATGLVAQKKAVMGKTAAEMVGDAKAQVEGIPTGCLG